MSCFLFDFDLPPCTATGSIVPFMDGGCIAALERKYNSICSNSSTLDPVFDGILIVRHKWFTSIALLHTVLMPMYYLLLVKKMGQLRFVFPVFHKN
jgi:hypothetical protein